MTAQTLLIAKNTETENPQNYRPIAIQNSTYKLYTSLITEFIMQHATQNEIITEEQAAGKIGSWGTTDQLLTNKMIYDEIINNRRNLAVAWLDYRKAFESVPHSWILESLKLAKVPLKIIRAIEHLMTKWRTKLSLHGEDASIETDQLEYHKGIIQGDTHSLILFILSVNPLSFLLSKEEGIELTLEEQARIITQLFFVDDLKLYAKSKEKLKALLDIVTCYTEDVGMKFGESKCAYNIIVRGKRKHQGENLKVRTLTVKELPEGDNYKYLGLDENIGFDGPLNKARVKKEYKRRIRKIWSSELNNINKITAHNTFAVPIIASGGGGGNAIYVPYGDVPPIRVYFLALESETGCLFSSLTL